MEATYNIQGKEYLVTDVLITKDTASTIQRACAKFETIEKEIKQFERDGFLTDGYAVCSVYVPLDKYKEFKKYLSEGRGSGRLSSSTKNIIILVIILVMFVFFYYFCIRPITRPVYLKIQKWWRNRFPKNKPTLIK